jgi:hypothetical protein
MVYIYLLKELQAVVRVADMALILFPGMVLKNEQ